MCDLSKAIIVHQRKPFFFSKKTAKMLGAQHIWARVVPGRMLGAQHMWACVVPGRMLGAKHMGACMVRSRMLGVDHVWALWYVVGAQGQR